MPWFKVITDQGKILTDESQVIGLLVQLSSTHYWAYTCCLSTKWSTWVLYPYGLEICFGWGFALRCFQLLSCPNIAPQRFFW